MYDYDGYMDDDMDMISGSTCFFYPNGGPSAVAHRAVAQAEPRRAVGPQQRAELQLRGPQLVAATAVPAGHGAPVGPRRLGWEKQKKRPRMYQDVGNFEIFFVGFFFCDFGLAVI